MKQEQGWLRTTAEQEEVDGTHAEGVCEIALMQDTDELHRRLAEDQSVNSISKVFVSVMMSASLSFAVKDHDINGAHFQEQRRNSCASDQSVC